MSKLYSIFSDLVEESLELYTSNSSNNRLKEVYKLFNKLLCKYYPNDLLRFYTKYPLKESLFDSLFLPSNKLSEAKDSVIRFNKSFEKLSYCAKYNDEDKYFRLNDVEELLKSYFDVTKIIFTSKVIQQTEIIELGILEDILNINYSHVGKCFSLYNPFAISAIYNTLKTICDFSYSAIKDEYSSEFINIRKHVIATCAIKSLSRLTTINKETYIIQYSEEKDTLLCTPMDKTASINKVKPIDLIDKIIAHIDNSFNNYYFNKNKFKISVFGTYQETDHIFDFDEIRNLINEIFIWLENEKLVNPAYADKSIEHLEINYYQVKTEDNCEDEVYTLESDNSRINIYVKDYDKYGSYLLENTINENDIVFFLDSPFLSTLKPKTESDLDTYCDWINNFDIDNMLYTNIFSSQKDIFNSLNDNVNLLATNNETRKRYGKILRHPKDYIYKYFEELINKYKDKVIYKDLYIFNSDFITFISSNYYLYPFTQTEIYNNTEFNILLFTSRTETPISISSKKDEVIYLPLWDLAKMIKHDYTFNDLNHILFELKYSFNSMYDCTININVKTKVKLDDKIINELIIPIAELFENDIFRNFDKDENKYIRTLFKNIIFNKAKNANDLFFLYFYGKKEENKSNGFSVNTDSLKIKKSCKTTSNFKITTIFSTFNDKYYYLTLLYNLALPHPPEYGMVALLNNIKYHFSNNSYNPRDKHAYIILDNIAKMCEIYDFKSNFLYKNTQTYQDSI